MSAATTDCNHPHTRDAAKTGDDPALTIRLSGRKEAGNEPTDDQNSFLYDLFL